MSYISVTNALNNNAATSDITQVGQNFTDVVTGLNSGTKDINVATITATTVNTTSFSATAITAATVATTGNITSSRVTGESVISATSADNTSDATATVLNDGGFYTALKTEGSNYGSTLCGLSNNNLSMLYSTSTNALLISMSTDVPIVFGSNNVERARITSGGLKVVAGFGCNGYPPQATYGSGYSLTAYSTGSYGLNSEASMHQLYTVVEAIKAALEANGILS